MKRMLINATQSEELRVAIVDVDTQNLIDLIVERQSYKTKTGNIYLGKISSVEPSLDAAFVNFGSERHGFLPLKEIARENFTTTDTKKLERLNIKELIKEGSTIMVQVEKEERGNKGAALTTFISLAGSYLVLMPNNPRAGGISRRVEGEERDELREILSALPLPEDMGVIIRTAGVGKTSLELQWDLNTLLKQWEAITKAAAEGSPPFLIHQESDIVPRTMRDYLRQDILDIIVDDPTLHEKIKNYLQQIRPDFLHCLKLYTHDVPLFNRYQIEHQIELAHQRELRLPSGGSVVIDHTEALVAIDVNSARSTKGGDIEETALRTNMEAAEKIACQLRLRDIGGLVVIDFIDMASVRHRREVENCLRNALKLDKARTQIGSISQRFGLLEMSRQRLRHSLGEATQVICPRCSGWGTIRGIESLGLSILRMIEEDAVKPHTAQLQVQLPIDVATYLINEKRESLTSIERQRNINITIIPNPQLESPKYRIKRVTEEETSGSGKFKPSYHLLETPEIEQHPGKKAQAQAGAGKIEEKPAVKHILPEEPAPSSKKPPSGIIKRLISSLFGAEGEEVGKPNIPATPSAPEPRPAARPPQGKPHRRDEKFSSGNRPPAGSREPKKTARPIPATPKEETTATTPTGAPQGEFKGRSRRGTRGGRRRSSGSPASSSTSGSTHLDTTPSVTTSGVPPVTENVPAVPTTTPHKLLADEQLPDYLPPFPSDLEDYYRDSQRFKGGKSSQAQPPVKPPQKSDQPVAAPPVATEAPVEKPPVPVLPETTSPSLPVTSAEQSSEPVIIRPQAAKEPLVAEKEKHEPTEPKPQESDSVKVKWPEDSDEKK
ncbi:MAG TPA: Rne/Rng family ribonuclease [Gammaproteobacteria bacterium]|nr:Rne/Rng family ribonuclease [Gammaproteobacteria bacterium]